LFYALRRLGPVRRLSSREIRLGGLEFEGKRSKRIKPRYAKSYYELVDAESEAWKNPYRAYSSKSCDI